MPDDGGRSAKSAPRSGIRIGKWEEQPDKDLIRLRFAQAADTYEQSAEVQCRVADKLLQMLAQEASLDAAPKSLLEIGCCTGLLTERIIARFPELHCLVASDLVPEFASRVREKLEKSRATFSFLAGDIEKVSLPGRFDLIISSSTLHWINDLPRLFTKLRDHLTEKGLLVFSLYGPENMLEIRAITDMGLRYRSMEELRLMLSAQYQVLACDQSMETLWFSDPVAVLRHLRATGVNSLARETWTRARLRAFNQAYVERFSGPLGVSLRYHPLYFLARPRR